MCQCTVGCKNSVLMRLIFNNGWWSEARSGICQLPTPWPHSTDWERFFFFFNYSKPVTTSHKGGCVGCNGTASHQIIRLTKFKHESWLVFDECFMLYWKYIQFSATLSTVMWHWPGYMSWIMILIVLHCEVVHPVWHLRCSSLTLPVIPLNQILYIESDNTLRE